MPAAVAPAAAAALLRNAHEKLGAELIKKLSAPFVLATPHNWWSARRRLIFYGQETKGWGGDKPGDDAGKLRSWLDGAAPERTEHLALLYSEFYGDGPERTSPFWRARRALVGDLQDWALGWSNLMRVDASPFNPKECGTWQNLTWEELWALCAWQRDLHHAELAALKPDAVIFFTGPNYDCCICRTLTN